MPVLGADTEEWDAAQVAPDPEKEVLAYLQTLQVSHFLTYQSPACFPNPLTIITVVQVTGAHAARVVEALSNTYGEEPYGWMTELKKMMADGSLQEFLKACSAVADPKRKVAEGVPPPTLSADAVPVKSPEWWASKRGRMLVQYTPSAQWAAYGAIPAGKGQIVTIRKKEDENWWMVTVAGVQGTVPASMVTIHQSHPPLPNRFDLTLPRHHQVEVIADEEAPTQLRQVNTTAKAAPQLNVPYHGRIGAVKSGFLYKSSAGKKESYGKEKQKKKGDFLCFW